MGLVFLPLPLPLPLPLSLGVRAGADLSASQISHSQAWEVVRFVAIARYAARTTLPRGSVSNLLPSFANLVEHEPDFPTYVRLAGTLQHSRWSPSCNKGGTACVCLRGSVLVSPTLWLVLLLLFCWVPFSGRVWAWSDLTGWAIASRALGAHQSKLRIREPPEIFRVGPCRAHVLACWVATLFPVIPTILNRDYSTPY